MGQFHDKRYHGESDAYRAARDALLGAEIALRRQIEQVAAMRRDLPLGGKVREDYVFDNASGPSGAGQARLSALFEGGRDILVLYSFMFAPDAETPCPMCTAFLDGLDGNARHIAQRVNLAVVAKAPVARIQDWASSRAWRNLRLLSSNGNSYNTDYFAETQDGAQWPLLNVFRKTAEGVFHTYATELFFAPAEDGQNNRHVDMLWPLWNALDLTPEGRGTDWYPSTS